MIHSQTRSAFTLVELSIVLVILGLLVGGVLSGQSLIRAAELRSITTEKDKYIVALNAFRDKYFALPGDMKNAFAFWGTDCGTDTADLSDGCNGNGDGKIEESSIGENLKGWEHLSRAGLIEGNYDGISNDASASAVNYQNIPTAKFPNAAWDLTSFRMNAPGNGEGLFLHFGGIDLGNTSNIAFARELTHGEAWNIDTKLDDGHANTGNVRGDGGADCYDAGADYYNIAGLGADYKGDCALHFILK